MLDGLDEVSWDRLSHAYGPAGDVPCRLRELTSSDPKVRAEAIGSLHASICHQGSRYRASAPTVPFLFEILDSPGALDRADLVRLLEGLAVGYPEWHVPLGFDPAVAHAEADALDDPDAVRGSDPDEDDEDWDPARDALWAQDAYEAVHGRLEVFHPLIRDPERAVRMRAVKILTWFPDAAAASASRVREVLAGRPGPEEAANATLALGILDRRLDDRSDVPMLASMTAGSGPVRLASAVSLAVILGSSAPAECLEVLLGALEDPTATAREAAAMDWHWLGPVGHAAAAVALIRPQADGPILGRLRRAAERVAEPMAGAEVFATLLSMVIPDPSSIGEDPRTGFRSLDVGSLTSEQRLALEAIGRAPVWDAEPFQYGRLMDVGLTYGLPWHPQPYRALLDASGQAAPGGG